MNPRAAINDLLPFQGSPFGQLGYFSLVETFPCSLYYECRREGRALESPTAMGAPRAVRDPAASRPPCCIYGEDGIRTHVPVKANGFQDRLVMTTSIPLHIKDICLRYSWRKLNSSKTALWCQCLFPKDCY